MVEREVVTDSTSFFSSPFSRPFLKKNTAVEDQTLKDIKVPITINKVQLEQQGRVTIDEKFHTIASQRCNRNEYII